MAVSGEQRELQAAMLRLNGRAWGLSLGMVLGIGLFLATNYLVWKGGDNLGQHLSLLRVFFPGYSVSFPGSVVGFIYAFVFDRLRDFFFPVREIKKRQISCRLRHKSYFVLIGFERC